VVAGVPAAVVRVVEGRVRIHGDRRSTCRRGSGERKGSLLDRFGLGRIAIAARPRVGGGVAEARIACGVGTRRRRLLLLLCLPSPAGNGSVDARSASAGCGCGNLSKAGLGPDGMDLWRGAGDVTPFRCGLTGKARRDPTFGLGQEA
jgi:hypothetical protein